MAKQYAVIHVQKHSSLGGSLGNHIQRTAGMEHTYPHANPDLREKNMSFSHIFNPSLKDMSLSQAVSARIEQGYKGKKAIRKDSVKFLSLILTGTHEQMMKIANDQNEFKRYLTTNASFLSNEYGKDNIVKLELHMDEKTPHLHAIVVPLTKDGRLSAKEVVGDRKKLKAFQDRYAAAMKPFGLERGEEQSQNTHITTKEFYQELEQTKKEVEKIDFSKLHLIPPAQKNELIKKLVKKEKFDTNIQDLNNKKGRGFRG